MSTTEEARHDLIEVLRTVIGHQPTGTLLGYLPPTGWADVATKQDLATVQRTVDLRLEAMEARFEARLHDALRKQTITLLTAMTALMGAFVAAIASL